MLWASKSPLAALATVAWGECPVLTVGFPARLFLTWKAVDPCLPADVFAEGLHRAEATWSPGTFYKQRTSQRTKASALCNFR